MASMAQGRSEISLSVMTDTTFRTATVTPRGFASHLLVRRNDSLVLVPTTNGTGIILPLDP